MNKWKIALLALLGITVSTPALAGPAVIVGALIGGAVAAGAAAAGLIAASVLTAAAIGAAVGAVAGALAPDLLGGMFDTPDFNVTQNAQAENDGILVNKTGMLQHIPVVYGQRKVGGPIVFMATQGDRNKYLYMAVVLSEGEIDSIGEVYINDVISTDSRYNGRLSIQKFTGTDNQGASTLLKEANGWNDNMKLSGIAYLACRFEWKKIEDQDDADANPFSGVPTVKAVIKGRKVASAATAGSVAYASETTGWSNNPADCILDYLRNPRYGRGLSNDRINFTSFSTARAKYGQTVTYVNGNRGPVLTCDAVIDTGRTLLDNTKIFLANARSGMPYVQGKFKLKPQDTGHETDSQNPNPNVVFNVDMDHIIDGVKLQGNGTREHFNQVKITYIDPTNEWKTNEVIYPELNSAKDQTYLAADNGRRLTKELAMNHIISKNIAADLGKIVLEQSRNRKNIEFTATAELHEVEVGDIINVDYEPLGIITEYRVNSTKLNNDYTVTLTASEHLPSNYIFNDTSTIFGASAQLKYVGDGTQSVFFTPQPDGSFNSVVAPPATANEPTLPISTPVFGANDFKIDTITQFRIQDNIGAQKEFIRVTCIVANFLLDQLKEVEIQEYNRQNKQWEKLRSFDPRLYLNPVTSLPLDGSLHTLRIVAVFDNGDRIKAVDEVAYTTQSSNFLNTTNVTF